MFLSRRFFHRLPFLFKNRPFLLADIGEGITEVEVIQWFVKEGERVKEFDRIAEVQSDKATVEITSRYDGVITKLHYKAQQVAKVGAPLVDIETEEGEHTEEKEERRETKVGSNEESQTRNEKLEMTETSIDQLATPAVRRLARELKVDLSKVKGTGKQGRILKEDLIKPQSTTPVVEPQSPKPHQVQLTPIQRAMIKSMNASSAVPQLSFCDEILVNNLYNLRKSLQPVAEQRGVKLSMLPFLIKAISISLSEHPIINSSFQNDILTLNPSHNIGVAIDSPNGLVVPNIKSVQLKSVFQIAQELNRLSSEAKKSLSPADIQQGTFTVSNIGAIGGTVMRPLLVVPQVCIVAVGKMQVLPRFENGQITQAKVITLSYSADHRVIEGAQVARFNHTLKELIENPNKLFFDLK